MLKKNRRGEPGHCPRGHRLFRHVHGGKRQGADGEFIHRGEYVPQLGWPRPETCHDRHRRRAEGHKPHPVHWWGKELHRLETGQVTIVRRSRRSPGGGSFRMNREHGKQGCRRQKKTDLKRPRWIIALPKDESSAHSFFLFVSISDNSTQGGNDGCGRKDVNGKLFHDEFMNVIHDKGSGWVDYMFPKPGQTQPSRKWSYVKAVKIDGATGLTPQSFPLFNLSLAFFRNLYYPFFKYV